MIALLLDHLIFFFVLAWLFVVPGTLFVRAFIGHTARLTPLELLVSGFGIGMILLDVSIIILNKSFNLPLSRILILLVPLVISLVALGALFWQKRTAKNLPIPHQTATQDTQRNKHVTFLAMLLIALTVAIKTIYLTDTIFPTATDMGHHLYWVNKIAQTHELQDYKKQILTPTEDGAYIMSNPQNVPDFIIGEHIPLAAVQIVTGKDILSPEPVFFLFLLDILSLLALFVFSLRLFARTPYVHTIALCVLFLMGPLYTISAAQAKFISGGVIGNLMGNLLIPLALFFLYRALTERIPRFLALFLLTVFGLIYTHHLSTFILAYVITFIIGFFILFHIRKLPHYVLNWLTLLFTPSVLVVLGIAVSFIFFVHIPSYLNPDAISSATGAPSKATRTGVDITQLIHTVGEARFSLAIVGLLFVTLFAFSSTRLASIIKVRVHTHYIIAFLLGWPLATFAMSTIPQYLGVNIISSRIANYTIIPFALIGGVGLAVIIVLSYTRLIRKYALATIFLILLFATVSGMYDNNQSLKTLPNITPAQETYAAARYLASHAAKDAWTIKDHNYLTADTWMKLFFLRDYSYPLSRSYFKRYDSGTRETCTREMISATQSTLATQCIDSLNVRYFMVSPQYDAAQFMRDPAFRRIYDSDTITIFSR